MSKEEAKPIKSLAELGKALGGKVQQKRWRLFIGEGGDGHLPVSLSPKRIIASAPHGVWMTVSSILSVIKSKATADEWAKASATPKFARLLDKSIMNALNELVRNGLVMRASITPHVRRNVASGDVAGLTPADVVVGKWMYRVRDDAPVKAVAALASKPPKERQPSLVAGVLSLSDQLLDMATRAADLEERASRKPDLSQFSVSDLLAEISRRVNAKEP